MGNIVQMNAASDAASSTFNFSKPIFGIITAVVCAVVIFGGFKGISRVTAVAIPVVSAVYLFISVRAVILDAERIPEVMRTILQSAFSVSAASGGVAGFLLSGALRHGVAKGSFTHEAGCRDCADGTCQFRHKNPCKAGTSWNF